MMTSTTYTYVCKHRQTFMYLQLWPPAQQVVHLDTFPISSVQHLLLFPIPLSSFNKITFTIFPIHIIYLFIFFYI